MRYLFILCIVLTTSFTVSAQVQKGQLAPDITLPNASDALVSLSAFKGKVVLLDFWASWCPPCRKANPSNVLLYNKYKALGFTIFAVSIDQKKQAWLKAIAKDGLAYPQVNDNQGWESPTAVRYGVNQIPTTFLIDKKGIIRGIDLEGATLKKMVVKLLAEKE